MVRSQRGKKYGARRCKHLAAPTGSEEDLKSAENSEHGLFVAINKGIYASLTKRPKGNIVCSNKLF
jgi:hypothetical protein